MNHELTHLDLFSGIGGFALAARDNGFRTLGFCEIEPYAQRVLGGRFPNVPIHDNIFKLDGGAYQGVTLLTGGFPCQPFSVAGEQRGSADDRHLWPEMLRVIKQARPTWIIGENVPGIIPMELDNCISGLEGCGYEVQPLVVPACAVDARHRRDRLWILAHANGSQRPRGSLSGGVCAGESDLGSGGVDGGTREVLAHPQRSRQSGPREYGNEVHPTAEGDRQAIGALDGSGPAIWQTEPRVGRVADGIPNRAHRLKGLGNAIVPQVAEEFIRWIAQIERGELT